jgi:Raf kinase inhibitor-like YbhB/YbcL family protein
MIPSQFTCDGLNQSLPLSWKNAPKNTKSFALIVEDPDAENGTFTHWVLFNIPPSVTSLATGTETTDGAALGKNSAGIVGYHGPCPPIGAHSYHFHLYALDKVLSLGEGATNDIVSQAMTGHVIGSAELIGLYQKSN